MKNNSTWFLIIFGFELRGLVVIRRFECGQLVMNGAVNWLPVVSRRVVETVNPAEICIVNLLH